MITRKKLSTLKERTRLRKISMILHEAAVASKNGQEVDLEYINDILPLADFPLVDLSSFDLSSVESGLEQDALAFRLEDMSQNLLARLGAEPSDWDFRDESGNLDVSHRVVQDKILVLDRIRSPYNVGAIFRSAEAFGISRIILVEGTASPDHVRALRTSLGGVSINEFSFPPRGVAVLGSEEFGISPAVLACCKRRVSIPMGGAKGSLNVSVAAGILLHRWF